MTIAKKDAQKIAELIEQLDQDRAWLLQKIDLGNWPEFREDLADLERELGQFLIKASDQLEQKD